MPRGNGTGPAGMGPMTGRGAGYCAGFGVPGYANFAGRGFFGCSGRGMGFRNRFFAAGLPGWQGAGRPPYYAVGLSADEEKDVLARQAKAFEDQLTGLRKRIAELETEKG